MPLPTSATLTREWHGNDAEKAMVTQHLKRALLIGTASLGTGTVLAQSGSGSAEVAAVLECAGIEREILRLECYDEAVAALRLRQQSGEARSGGPSPAPSAAARGETETQAGGDSPASAEAPESGSTPQVAAERNLQGNAPARAARSGEQDADRADDGDREVTVVEVRTSIPGRAVFITSDGEEFVQTSGRLNLFLPDVPFQASLRAGAVGGKFLTPEGTRRSIRITQRD